MARSNRFSVAVGLVVAVAAASASRPAFAIKQFFDEFKTMYVKADSTDPAEKALATAVETEKCNVCHVGKSKKERNAYGEALAGLLDKKEDAKNVDKIRQALEEVAALPSAVAGKTFGDLIAEGKLPAGE